METSDHTPLPAEGTPKESPGAARGLIWSVVVDGLGPLVVYHLVKARPHTTEFAAIGWSTVPPMVNSVQSLVRKRRVDIIGVIVILGLLAGLGLLVLGGSPRLLLVRDSLITGVIGLAFLLSLPGPRPLLFYVLRQVTTANDPAEAAAWDADYAKSRYKFGLPLTTAVWGLMLAGEAALRTLLALRLPIPTYLAVSPVVNVAMYAGTALWSYRYVGWVQKAEEAWEGGREKEGGPVGGESAPGPEGPG